MTDGGLTTVGSLPRPVPVMIAKYLNFDVSRLRQILFEIQPSVAKRVFRFRGRVAPTCSQFHLAFDDPHPFSAAAGHRLQHHRKARFARLR